MVGMTISDEIVVEGEVFGEVVDGVEAGDVSLEEDVVDALVELFCFLEGEKGKLVFVLFFCFFVFLFFCFFVFLFFCFFFVF